MSSTTTTSAQTTNEALARIRKSTDLGNAERLADRACGRLLYVHGIGWMAWDGRRWQRALSGEEMREASDMVRAIYGEAALIADLAAGEDDDGERQRLSGIATGIGKWARASESVGRIKAALELGRSQRRLVARVADLDADPDLLNVGNGILNLRTLELLDHDPARKITRVTNAAYEATPEAPFWRSLVERVVPDPDVRRWVQMAAGYSMLGSYSEWLFLLHGQGANGKSTFLWGLRNALGDYAGEATPDLLVQRREWDAGTYSALASLRGRRLVTTTETEEGKRMAEVLVKQLTGEAEITAKFMRQDHFTFENQAAVWLSTNHKPVVQGGDYAIWRRIRLIPFDVTIPESERIEPGEVRRRLGAERDGILAWLVEGLRMYQQAGLHDAPEAVSAATGAYKDQMDPLREWLEDECVADESAFTPYANLRSSYEFHCATNGRQALGARRFGEALAERGYLEARDWVGEAADRKRVRGRRGIRFTTPSPSVA
jgi:putative DNA primase/helicase